jgi:hypothetical protein
LIKPTKKKREKKMNDETKREKGEKEMTRSRRQRK